MLFRSLTSAPKQQEEKKRRRGRKNQARRCKVTNSLWMKSTLKHRKRFTLNKRHFRPYLRRTLTKSPEFKRRPVIVESPTAFPVRSVPLVNSTSCGENITCISPAKLDSVFLSYIQTEMSPHVEKARVHCYGRGGSRRTH